MVLRVFLSSTFLEFKEERRMLHRVLTRYLSVACDMAEYLTSNSLNLENELKKWIDNSDIVVLLLGMRYGSTNGMISWTRKEIEHAKSTGKKIYPYLKDQEIPTTIIDVDMSKQRALDDFVEFVRKNVRANIPIFETNDDLAAAVAKNIAHEVDAEQRDLYNDGFE